AAVQPEGRRRSSLREVVEGGLLSEPRGGGGGGRGGRGGDRLPAHPARREVQVLGLPRQGQRRRLGQEQGGPLDRERRRPPRGRLLAPARRDDVGAEGGGQGNGRLLVADGDDPARR